MRGNAIKTMCLLGLLLCAACLLGVIKGAVDIPLGRLFSPENHPIVLLRLLRVAMAVTAGIGLAVSGIVLQSVLHNPLAEPYLLGTSNGAGLGAVVALSLGVSSIYIPAAAFIGALLSIVAVYYIAKEHAAIPEQSLILAGVMVSVAISAVIVCIITVSGKELLHGIAWWLWGNLQVFDASLLALVSVLVAAGVAVVFLFSRELNAISIGDEDALHLGIEVEKLKKLLLLVTALITASLVCVSGIIGFVGLLIPHMMRRLVGPDHKVLIPAASCGAAFFMVACDLVSRCIMPPLEIPIGVITALLGAPVFLVLLKKRYGR